VPEKRRELTTEGGLDAVSNFKRVRQVLQRLEKEEIAVSLFIDPDKKQIAAAKRAGAKMIELHTGRYAEARNKKEEDKYFHQIRTAARYAKNNGLRVFAGHGLNYYNVARIVSIKEIEELNIGYSIVCRAVLAGLERAVREMKTLVK
jgi:pyridoxine 5-phosphate synthase